MTLPAYKRPDLALDGNDFRLRPLRESDATARYAAWLSDAETTRYLETKPGNTTPASLVEYIRHHANRLDSLLLGIFAQPAMEHVGNVKLEPIVVAHRRAVLGIMIGESFFRGRGLGSAVIRRVLTFAFGEMGMHRVELGVTADNTPAITCYERLGFVLEGTSREATWRDGHYVDNLHYAILANESMALEGIFHV